MIVANISITMPPPKRQRGRPRKSSSVTPSQSQSDTSSQPAFSPRNESIDLGALGDLGVSVLVAENNAATAEAVSSSQGVTERDSSVLLHFQPVNRAENEALPTVEEFTPGGHVLHEMRNLEEGTGPMDIDLAVITVGDITLSKSNPALCIEDAEFHATTSVGATYGQAPLLPADVSPGVGSQQKAGIDAEVAAEAEGVQATVESMKEKLRSLVGDLSDASLTREEINAFEDLFMDAKEALYGAGRRGRSLKG
jgi:hypothetical protein